MTEPYRYARLEGGMRRYLLYAELRSALYCALVDLAQHRATPLGIRQGRRILYRHSDLVALATAHQGLLAAPDHWPLIQALAEVARLAS